ncbi:MAG: hypothetical protein RML56_00535 [Burkholderiales bacterium]|nr:hypothetical protein [Burkholderiales bacterium]
MSATAAIFAATASACESPATDPAVYRRLVARVKYLPDVEAWAAREAREGAVVQFLLHLDAPQRRAGQCYWTVEVRAGDRLWRRYLVATDRDAEPLRARAD